MNIVKLLLVFILGLALVIGIRFKAAHAQQRTFDPSQVAAKVAALQPFTITSRATVTSLTGATMQGDVQTWSADANRHAHRIVVANPKTGIPDIEQIDIHEGTTHTLYSSVTRSAMSVNQAPGFMTRFWAGQPDPSSNCLTSYAGVAISGYNLQIDGPDSQAGARLIRMKPYANNSATVQVWVAPDFGCATVKATYDSRGEGGRTVQQIVTADQGHVDESLFNVPADYEQVSPSEFYIREAKATAAGKNSQIKAPDKFSSYLQGLMVRFKGDDDYWATHKAQ